MKFKENWSRDFRGEVVQRGLWKDGQADDGRGVITIAHPKHEMS